MDVLLGSKICDSCRKNSLSFLISMPILTLQLIDASACKQYVDAAETIGIGNKCLLEIGKTAMPVHPSSRRIDKKMTDEQVQ